MCKAFHFWRAFLLSLNIVAVPQIFTFPPQPLPLEKGGAWSLCSILGDIWVSNRLDAYRNRKAFPFGRAFLLPLNIMVMPQPLHTKKSRYTMVTAHTLETNQEIF